MPTKLWQDALNSWYTKPRLQTKPLASVEKMMHNRKNNFDFLRLLFASFVIITHSYSLSGIVECDFLCQISKGQISFSEIGVKGFFVISGYLIFQSLERSNHILDYFWKRFLRLYPGLFVVLLLTLILALCVYQHDTSLLQNKSLLTYMPNNLALYGTQHTIDGVFESNPYPSVINGSLWTIPYEFTMYILLSVLILFKKKKTMNKILLLTAFLLLLIANLFYFEQLKHFGYLISAEHLLDLGIFFIAGSLLAAMPIQNIPRKKVLLILVFVFVISSICFGFYEYSKYFSLPVLFILFGLNPLPFISTIGNKIGDLSYGIYIYGFPVQQTLMYCSKLNHIELMTYSLLISFLLAYFSWHLIEEKALTYKNLQPSSAWQSIYRRISQIKSKKHTY